MNTTIASVAQAATIPGLIQIAIGVVLFIIVLRSMRHHSVGYTAAVVIAVAAPLYIHSFVFISGAIVVAGLIALATLCTRTSQPSHS
jgi:hypothetical protein